MTEVEYLKGKLADTEAQLEREERKQSLNDSAERIKDLYDAFIKAEFSAEQAWFLTGTIVQALFK